MSLKRAKDTLMVVIFKLLNQKANNSLYHGDISVKMYQVGYFLILFSYVYRCVKNASILQV